jgi:hypothetical protein
MMMVNGALESAPSTSAPDADKNWTNTIAHALIGFVA